MKKKTKIIIITLLALIVIAICYVYFFTKKTIGNPLPAPAPANPNQSGSSTSAAPPPQTAQGSGINTTILPPPASTVLPGLQPNANIFAGGDTTNVYSDCNIDSNTQILQTYNLGNWMGNLVGPQGDCLEITMKTFAQIWPFPPYQSGTVNGYIENSNPIYGCNPNGTDANGNPCTYIKS